MKANNRNIEPRHFRDIAMPDGSRHVLLQTIKDNQPIVFCDSLQMTWHSTSDAVAWVMENKGYSIN